MQRGNYIPGWHVPAIGEPIKWDSCVESKEQERVPEKFQEVDRIMSGQIHMGAAACQQLLTPGTDLRAVGS